MLRNTLLALAFVGCASADTVKEHDEKIKKIEESLGMNADQGADKPADGEDAAKTEGEGDAAAAEPTKLLDRIAALEEGCRP